jgi:hypothetical protein
LKARKTDASATDFLHGLENEQRRRDGSVLLDVFTRVTKNPPGLWGSSIVGFGEYHYKSARSLAQGDWPLTGFSPRKRNITVYIRPGFSDYQELQRWVNTVPACHACI